MSLYKNAKELTVEEELAALARVALPDHTAKRLARLMRIQVRTARHWLHNSFAKHMAPRSAAMLLVEMDRQDREERAETRRRLREIAGDGWVLGIRPGERSAD